MTSTTTISDPRVNLRQLEQEDRCRALLNSHLPVDSVITTDMARIIAASIHGGSETTLGCFAATGALSVPGALTELEHIQVPAEQTDWVVALWEHLEQHDNDAPEDSRTEVH